VTALNYDFEERAVIMEHDGGLRRPEAAAAALTVMAERKGDLRPYQSAGVDALRSALKAGRKRVVFYLPTGGGKTRVAGEIIAMARARGKRVAFVCNRIELVGQASEAFYALGIEHGIIQADNTRAAWSDVVVCSVQTLARRGVGQVDLAIIDEAHGCAASRAYHTLFKQWATIPIIGLTATPFSRGLGRSHDFLGGGLFEEIVCGATISELIAQDFLVDCDIYAPSEPDLSNVKIVAGDYHEGELEKATNTAQLIGDIVLHWQKHAAGTQTLCFAVTIAHSQHIVEQFVAAGIKAQHVDAYTPESERKRIIGGFRQGKFQVLSNCAMLAEGFDCPAARTLILARPTKSLIRYIQMIGRILRPHAGKEKALVLDHSGSAKRLGFPTDELPLVLDDGTAREAKDARDKKDALPKPCTECHFLKPARAQICPACGHKPAPLIQVETADGELAKLERTGKAARKANREVSWPDKAAWMGSFLTYAQRKGYKPGWAANNYRDKFGAWPNDDRVRYVRPCEVIPDVQRWITHKNIAWAKSKRKRFDET
jgi:DNA repair protein RadD